MMANTKLLTLTWTCGEGTNGVQRRFSGFICSKPFCFVRHHDKWSSNSLRFSIITHLNQHIYTPIIDQWWTIKHWQHFSVVVLGESPCLRGPIYKSLSSDLSPCPGPQVLVLGPQNPRKLSRTLHSANSPLCMIMWSTNLVTATMHDITVKNGLLTDIRYYLLISR